MDRATEHAKRVISGEEVGSDEVSGILHIKACERHLKDLERQETANFPYIWKPDKSQRIIEFSETLTIAEGFKSTPLHLYENQCFDLGVPMGWVHKDTGNRRFRRSYESMARQNGKSFKNGIRSSYISNFCGYSYGKLFAVATKLRQAKIVWAEAAKFISIDPELSELYKIQEYKHLITALGTHCTIEALSKESGLDDGFRSIFNSIDEIHQHRDNSIYKALYNGTRALPETLTSMITTRGKDLNSFCFDMDKYCIDILDGAVVADDFFVDIYTIDKDDDYFDEKIWIKANPVLCQTESGMEIMRRDAQTARDMGGADLSDFLVKCLNVWYRGRDNQFVDAEKFLKCGQAVAIDKMSGRLATAGLDLSSGGDLTTIALEFEIDDTYYFWTHSYMPRGRFEEHIKTDLADYDVWEKNGLLTVTGSADDFKNDYKFIISELKALLSKHNIKLNGIACDPHNVDGILSDLETFGVPVTMITQSAKQLNDATLDVQLNVESGKLLYDGENKLMVWSFLNAVTVANSYGEIKVDKEVRKRTRRIDPVDACIDAHVLVLASKKDTPIDYDEQMKRYLAAMNWDK